MSPLNVQLRAVRALRDYNTGSSQRQAANNNYINRNYLRRRIQGVPTRESVNASFQTLFIAQESFLVNWAVIQGRLGYAPRVIYFQQFAERLLAIEGVPQQLGRCWYRRFLSRNPFVRTLRSKLLDYKRANGASIKNINIFFDRLDDPALAGIFITNFYNADEFGLF
jgi:hypothetical protein